MFSQLLISYGVTDCRLALVLPERALPYQMGESVEIREAESDMAAADFREGGVQPRERGTQWHSH
jgi:hypothetical protein